MNGVRPLIVVSLPARSVDEAKPGIASAAAAGADLVELRLDRWSPDAVRQLGGLFPSPVPLLATLRSRAEGGDGPDDAALRAPLLRTAGAAGFRWIDLEWDRDQRVGAELEGSEGPARIYSVHLPAGASPAVWERRIEELSGAAGFGKLVGPLGVGPLLEHLLPAIRDRAGSSLTVHTTGPSGPLLRALAKELRFPLVYAAPTSGDPSVEASQIPIDRMLPFLRADVRPPLFAIVGRPVEHSRSPEIHGAWMRDGRHAGLYLALEFRDEDEFVGSLDALHREGFRGLNVTQPYKRAAYEASSQVSPGARASGAVNCLTFAGDEVLGENTDLVAIARRLDELVQEGRWDGRSLAVLGAGGAARATLAAARLRGAAAAVYARRQDEAERLAREFGADAPGRPAGPSSLVVHASTAGRAGSGPPPDWFHGLVGRESLVLDWVYRPDEPHFRSAATRAGAAYEDGWRLLVYQAVASYAIWWGEPPSERSVDATLREGGCTA